jgi:hypothetical protein
MQCYVSICKGNGWDDWCITLKIKENEVKGKYERNKSPDPCQYYVKSLLNFLEIWPAGLKV